MNFEAIAEQGFFVPRFRKGSHKYLLARDLKSLFSNNRSRRKEGKIAQREMSSWKLKDKRGAIVSFEGHFLSTERSPHANYLSARLGARHAQHEYVIWVRDPVSWARSVLLQDLKKGRFRCSPRFLDLSSALLTFHSRLSSIPQAVSIEFREYASRSANEGGSVSDFLRFAGLELTQQMVFPDIDVNPSLSPEAGLMVAELGENLMDSQRFDKRHRKSIVLDFSVLIRKIDQEVGPYTANLREEFVETIQARNRGMLEWLALIDRPKKWTEPAPAPASVGLFGEFRAQPPSQLIPQVFNIDGERLELLRSSIASAIPASFPVFGTNSHIRQRQER